MGQDRQALGSLIWQAEPPQGTPGQAWGRALGRRPRGQQAQSPNDVIVRAPGPLAPGYTPVGPNRCCFPTHGACRPCHPGRAGVLWSLPSTTVAWGPCPPLTPPSPGLPALRASETTTSNSTLSRPLPGTGCITSQVARAGPQGQVPDKQPQALGPTGEEVSYVFQIQVP